MKAGVLLALVVFVLTIVVVAIGTIWPNQHESGVVETKAPLVGSSSPEDALNKMLQEVSNLDWPSAYESLANKSEFTEAEFMSDIMGSYGNLHTYSRLSGFNIYPEHATSDEAKIRTELHWASVVENFTDNREVSVVRKDGRWAVAWPIFKEPKVPPQVIPVNYLRWDVVYRGAGDDWGVQDVEGPHVRILDMHPVDRPGGLILMGEVLNEDVVPALVTVHATLVDHKGGILGSEESFDMMNHILLPKQVTPFRINFKDIRLPQVDSVRMQPSSSLVSASADPVIGIESQRLNPVPDASLTGEVVNQSGQVVNIAHVIGTFYDANGQIVWVADNYPTRALLPESPVPFHISLPADIAAKVSSYRVVAGTYMVNRF